MRRPRTVQRALAKIGQTVRGIREEQGRTQEDVADAAQSDARVIGGVERGERNISVLNLLYVAAALRTLPDDFFRGVTLSDLERLPPKSQRRPGRKKTRRRGR